jgi:predicted CopG family antitoxin
MEARVHMENRMAAKTITIDAKAYNRLKSVRKPNESFSDTINRVVKAPFDVKAWLKTLQKNALSDEALDAIEEVVAQRRRGSSQERRRAAS